MELPPHQQPVARPWPHTRVAAGAAFHPRPQMRRQLSVRTWDSISRSLRKADSVRVDGACAQGQTDQNIQASGIKPQAGALARQILSWYGRVQRKTKIDCTIMNKKIASLMLLAGLAAVPITFTTGCAVTQHRETAGRYVDDKSVSTRVKTSLYRDPIVKGTQVNV